MKSAMDNRALNWEQGGYSMEAFANLSKADKIQARAAVFDELEKELKAKREKAELEDLRVPG